MEPEEREILRRVLELSQKNNRMLQSIQRSMFWSKLMRYIYWIIIIGAAVGAYYFIDPYITGVIDTYNSLKGNISNIIQKK
jgi:hypothetical protein